MNDNRTHSPKSAPRQRGLTLVEILVALVISLFLVAGVIQLLVGLKQTYRFHEAMARIQENGRFALEMISRDIRMAGYYGCLTASATSLDNTLNSSTGYFWNFGQAIQGSESTGSSTWSPALDSSITSPLSGSDVITVRGVDGPAYAVTVHGGGTGSLTAPSSSFAVGNIAIASNCETASAFQITGITSGVLAHGTTATNVAPSNPTVSLGNSTQTLANNYAGGEIAPASTKSYYIRTGSGGKPALWRRVGADAPQELVEGVEDMEILYGVCTGQGKTRSIDPNTGYKTADWVNTNNKWPDVCSVRVNLLLVSLLNLEGKITGGTNFATNRQSVIFPADTGSATGSAFTPSSTSDRNLRQPFSTTVGIRDRLP